ncbi:MAG TPA: cupin domain-containing protein [Thermoleophilaceae bacterium]|jgi:quercetin dioxygenase-like cupin family protein
MAEPQVVDWLGQDFSEVRPGIHGATIDSEQLTVTVYRYEPGSSWEEHAHPEDQVTTVVSGGEIEFTVGGNTVRLRPGQLALIPGGTPHSARTGDEEVVALNVWRLRS